MSRSCFALGGRRTCSHSSLRLSAGTVLPTSRFGVVAGTQAGAAGQRGAAGIGGMQQGQQGSSMPGGSAAASAALVRRSQPAPVQQQEVFVDMSQVVGKKVITRTTGRDLGTVACLWVDPRAGEVVSLDLDDKKGAGSTRIANIYLSRLTQIGDVVLVHDESVLYDQPLDGRYGFVVLPGMDVRTRSGDFLGKVRDFAFSPDTGAVAKIVYDDFGLSFLPVTFFDTFSISMGDVLSVGMGGVVVSEEAKYRERKETAGVFAAIPSLLRSLNSGSRQQPVAGLLSAGTADSYRQDGQFLPQGYSYDQWENDVRRWEQETGLSYDQYIRTQQGQGQGARPGTQRSLAAGSTRSVPMGQQPQQQQQQQAGMPMGRGAQQQQQPQQAGSRWGGVASMQPPALQQQQQMGMSGARGMGGAGPGGMGGAPAGAPQQQAYGSYQPRNAPLAARGGGQQPQQQDPRYRQAQQPQQPQQPPRAAPQQPQQPQQAGGAARRAEPGSAPPSAAAGGGSDSGGAGGESSGRPLDDYISRADRAAAPQREPVMEEVGASGGWGAPTEQGRGAAPGRGGSSGGGGGSWGGYYDTPASARPQQR
ncbi:hypothetical protein FOA52_009919 [Chlamydomonas sp. UWO 241]|nr:hypothetical protein FOA52_009919 [Chlamydomonas sp. UWO 241]